MSVTWVPETPGDAISPGGSAFHSRWLGVPVPWLGVPLRGAPAFAVVATKRAPLRSRLPAGLTAFRGVSGERFRRATRLQPDVAPVATALLQSTRSSVQQPHGDGRFRGGATGESPKEGSGLSRGGNTVGTRSSEGVRRPSGAVGWGTADPGRRTFRSLERLIDSLP
jgi:hypothetical protein